MAAARDMCRLAGCAADGAASSCFGAVLLLVYRIDMGAMLGCV